MRSGAIAFGVLLALGSHVSAQALDPALSARQREFDAAMREKNSAKVAAFYTEDAVSYGDGARIVKGRAPLQKQWDENLKDGRILTMNYKVVDAQVSGNVGYLYGTFAFPTSNGKPGRTGHFLQVWKRVGTQWLIAYDTFSDDPASAATATKK